MKMPMAMISEEDQSTYLWINAILGFLSLATLLNVAHLVKTKLDFAWKSLMGLALSSASMFLIILGLKMSRSSIPRNWLDEYIEELTEAKNQSFSLNSHSYPPKGLLLLLILKDFGATLGLCSSIALFILMIKILVKIEVCDQNDITDVEDEDWKAFEKEHRDSVKIGMASLSTALLICALLNIGLMGYNDAININYPNSKTHLEVFKIFLSFSCILCSSLMMMFHEKSSETRELALFFGATILAIFTLQHVVALRFVST